ncbi:MAG: DUF481 domain-containing protein [Candidatus Omnitrophota bacterium]
MVLSTASADQEIFLTNEDRLSGTIIKETNETITLETELLGTIIIDKKNIEKIQSEKKPALEREQSETGIEWTRKFEAGYNVTSGNTKADSFSLSTFINRKTFANETTFKADIFQSSSQDTMDAQRWSTMARYAYSFWKRKWYHLYKLEVDHDKFANVDYRIIPVTGIGYWFSDALPLKAMVECSTGLEHTEYNNDTEDSDDAILLPRAYIEWQFLGKLSLSEEVFTYVPIDDFGDYRLTSISTFSCPIMDNLSFNIHFVNEYDASPAAGAKKHDKRLTSSIAYEF